jgi:hypothetical protein
MLLLAMPINIVFILYFAALGIIALTTHVG